MPATWLHVVAANGRGKDRSVHFPDHAAVRYDLSASPILEGLWCGRPACRERCFCWLTGVYSLTFPGATRAWEQCPQRPVDYQVISISRSVPSSGSLSKVRLTEPMGHHPTEDSNIHRPRSPRSEHLGYAARRVLVSRKWSGKTPEDHGRDRKAWLIATLGLEPPGPRPVHVGGRGRATRPCRRRARRWPRRRAAAKPATRCLLSSRRRSLGSCQRFKQNAQLAYHRDLRQSQVTIR